MGAEGAQGSANNRGWAGFVGMGKGADRREPECDGGAGPEISLCRRDGALRRDGPPRRGRAGGGAGGLREGRGGRMPDGARERRARYKLSLCHPRILSQASVPLSQIRFEGFWATILCGRRLDALLPFSRACCDAAGSRGCHGF